MLKSLHRGGVFVLWIRNWTIDGPVPLPNTGSKTHVGGVPARVVTDRSAELCSSLKATTAVTAYISGGFEMDACARGINSGRFEAQVEAMLNSLAFRPTHG
jgi:hypothetical protein